MPAEAAGNLAHGPDGPDGPDGAAGPRGSAMEVTS